MTAFVQYFTFVIKDASLLFLSVLPNHPVVCQSHLLNLNLKIPVSKLRSTLFLPIIFLTNLSWTWLSCHRCVSKTVTFNALTPNNFHNINKSTFQNKEKFYLNKMKFALALCFLGLQTVLAVSPFEAIVEEWEVFFLILLDGSCQLLSILFRPGNWSMGKFTQETMEMLAVDTVRKRVFGWRFGWKTKQRLRSITDITTRSLNKTYIWDLVAWTLTTSCFLVRTHSLACILHEKC